MSQDSSEESLQRVEQASEESLKDVEQAIEEGRKAADEAPIMPFGDQPAGTTPEDTGGATAAHGDDAATPEGGDGDRREGDAG